MTLIVIMVRVAKSLDFWRASTFWRAISGSPSRLQDLRSWKAWNSHQGCHLCPPPIQNLLCTSSYFHGRIGREEMGWQEFGSKGLYYCKTPFSQTGFTHHLAKEKKNTPKFGRKKPSKNSSFKKLGFPPFRFPTLQQWAPDLFGHHIINISVTSEGPAWLHQQAPPLDSRVLRAEFFCLWQSTGMGGRLWARIAGCAELHTAALTKPLPNKWHSMATAVL